MIILNWLLSLDILLSNTLSNLIPHNQFTDYFFAFLSLYGYSVYIWILIVGTLVLLKEKTSKKKHIVLYFIVTFLLSTVVVSYVLKTVFHRQRPIPNKLYSSIACPSDYSFPSGHAGTAFASATFLAAVDKKRKWFYYSVAVLISLSRIYLECHYVLDVIGGAVVGIAIGRFVLFIRGKRIFNWKLPE